MTDQVERITVSDGNQTEGRSGPLARALPLLMLSILLAQSLLNLPRDYNLVPFGFSDQGACLTLHEQVENGRLPYRDFDYLYGLLPIPLGQAWFSLLGRNPAAFLLGIGLCNLLVIWAVLRFVQALHIGLVGQVWLLVTLPMLTPSSNLTLTHALEAALICHALAEQARGRRPVALMLATVCLFIKPSMAYFLGLALVLFTMRELFGPAAAAGERRPAAFLKALLPAGVTGLFLLGGLAAWIGLSHVVESLLPLKGMEVLAKLEMVPSTVLENLLLLEVKSRFNFYLGTHLAFLVAGTLLLTAGGLANLPAVFARAGPGSPGFRRAECVVTCAFLNLAHFGLMVDYIETSYAAFLGLGLAALAAGRTAAKIAVSLLALVTCLGYYATFHEIKNAWSSAERHEQFGSLWCRREMAEEWLHVLDLTRGQSPVLLARVRGYDRLFEGFVRPTNWFFDPGLVNDKDLHRQLDYLAQARLVVVATKGIHEDLFKFFPALKEGLGSKRVLWRGTYLTVYRADERSSLPLEDD